MNNNWHIKEGPLLGLTGLGGGPDGFGLVGGITPGEYIDDIYSTDLWTGNGQTGRAITTNVDTSTDGGLVWIKERTGNEYHNLFDTARGWDQVLYANMASGQEDQSGGTRLRSFTTTGFTLGGDTSVNASGDFAGYSFKKTPGFFDIVTYTGNGTARSIAHNLGSTPGMIMIKRLDTTQNWEVYHRSVEIETGDYPYVLRLNDSTAQVGNQTFYESGITSTEFKIASYNAVNANGGTYVAYLFAHDEQSFGVDGKQSVIQCGGYTGNGTGSWTVKRSVTLGWEPQWVLIKAATAAQAWFQMDDMRGIFDQTGDNLWDFQVNAGGQEEHKDYITLNPTGFDIKTGSDINTTGVKYVYMAIRRPDGYVGKPVELGTKVFTPTLGGNNTTPLYPSAFAADFNMRRTYGSQLPIHTGTRLTGPGYMTTNSTMAEGSTSGSTWDYMDGMGEWAQNATGDIAYNFKRHAGFDVVTYEGDGASGHEISHGLGNTPEMAWIKNRDGTNDWAVYHKDMHGSIPEKYYMELNKTTDRTYVGNGWFFTPTSTVFKLGDNATVNQSSVHFLMMLFASVTGVSKVGSYSVSDATVNKVVDVGFAPRFVIIKCINAGSTNWVATDTVRGSSDGNTPLLFMNSDAAENYATQMYYSGNTFVIKTSAGGQLLNNGGEYIYYAHA